MTVDTVGLPPADGDIDQIAYRPLSAWAPVSLLVSALSAVALVHPILWVVPIAGALVAATAIRAIRADPQLSGRSLALAGLAISLLFATWAPTRFLARRHMVLTDSAEFVQNWIHLLQTGNTLQAHQWTLTPRVRTHESDLKAHYDRESISRSELNSFLREPGMRTLVKFRDQADVRMVRIDGPLGNSKRNLVQVYLEIATPTLPHPIPIRIGVERWLMGGRVEWRVVRIERRKATAADADLPTDAL